MSDETWMKLAIDLAQEVEGLTAPNPPVGCVLVRDEEVIGQGAHPGAGQPHAERIAIADCHAKGNAPKGATAFVTLEPCSTHGRTGACTEALVESGIARVVYGSVDPNPEHAGGADTILEKAGIEVTAGLLAEECDRLIAPFRKWILEKKPWVIAKAGTSLDGRLQRPKGESQWITSPASRDNAQNTLRSRCDAILIGAETARVDNPSLTFRGSVPTGKEQPWRVIVTRSGNLPSDLKLLTDEHRDRTLVYENQSLDEVLADLAERGVLCVLAEGGGTLHGELFAGGHVDEVVFYLAPRISGGGAPAVGGIEFPEQWGSIQLERVEVETLGDDIRFSGLVQHSRPAIFFDRDGVINVPITEGGGYVLQVEDFQLRDGAADALRTAKEAGYPVILITNQKCVAKGLISESELAAIHDRMQGLLLAEAGVAFDAIYACTDDPTHPDARYKPSPTLFHEAAADHTIDLARSIMVGDQDRDIEAALAAEVGATIRVLEKGDPEEVAADFTTETVSELASILKDVLRATAPGQ